MDSFHSDRRSGARGGVGSTWLSGDEEPSLLNLPGREVPEDWPISFSGLLDERQEQDFAEPNPQGHWVLCTCGDIEGHMRTESGLLLEDRQPDSWSLDDWDEATVALGEEDQDYGSDCSSRASGGKRRRVTGTTPRRCNAVYEEHPSSKRDFDQEAKDVEDQSFLVPRPDGDWQEQAGVDHDEEEGMDCSGQ